MLLPPSPARNRKVVGVSSLASYLDSLIQAFENCRPGLTDAAIADPSVAADFFLGLYAKEAARLRETIAQVQTHLPQASLDAFFQEADGLIRQVVVPAYVRHCQRLTARERRDFFLAPEPWHLAERLGWTLAGAAVGGLVVWAPFIPLWSKEWVLPFMLGGLFFPEIRRYVANLRYEKELNKLVAKADAEIGRIEVAYLVSGVPSRPELGAVVEAGNAPVATRRDAGRVH